MSFSSPTQVQPRHTPNTNMSSSPPPSSGTPPVTPTGSRSQRTTQSTDQSPKNGANLSNQQVKILKETPLSQKRYSLPVGKKDNMDVMIPKGPTTSSNLSRSTSQRNSPRKPLITDVNNIKVITRFRPENSSEKEKGHSTVIKEINEASISLKDGTFTFDRVFGPDSTQADVFDYSVLQTVEDFFNGYNGTVLTYGQTGSGKTFTMMGDLEDDSMKGLIPRIADSIFTNIRKGDPNTEFTLSASYMEIYMEQIRDLLSSSNKETLQVVEDKINGVHVTNLTKAYISSTQELHALLQRGSELRVTSSTEMNKESSRSHAIFQLNLNQESPEFGIRRSKLFLVDLAGSEKVGKTGVSGLNLEEAKKINSSLSSLGNVINALTDIKSTHIPYRDSKLTRILQESLGGNSRTSLIINCSPSSYNEFETLSTLRFGTRAKKIKNKAHVNTEPSSQDLLKQIEILKRMNEDHVLQNKELECELDLWRSGINKMEASEDERSMKDTQKDFDTTITDNEELAEKLKEANLKIDALVEQLSVYQEILSKVPESMNSTSSGDLYEQLKASQEVNDSLMADVTHKCERLIEMELQIDSLEQEMRKVAHWKLEHEKYVALEKTIEHMGLKLDELEVQGNTLRKDLQSTKNISETRHERIKTLEQLVKDQQSQIPRIHHKSQSSKSQSSKFSFIKNPFYYSNGSSSTDSNLSSETLQNSSDLSSAVDGDSDGYVNNVAHRPSLENDDLKCRRNNRRDSNTSSNSSLGNGALSGGRVGFNLHVVKPMRGGAQ
ncbi:hypothetical protein WICPIJ_010076 [Wickerhamomyces pijperi]|uniref:Kinesin-like protein n=1 Tax=Wickerhamomyces pijperi TaxID=599730 RepID=A0A9P8PJ35_WICPI|nr:hypothetical protein WICPIJ_010076 [Wickerhamomyces pijperi]